MIHLTYALKEIRHRRARSLATTGSVALATLLAVVLITFAGSYSQAIRQPMKALGSDALVQLTGDIPPKLEGVVFPHPNALLPEDLGRQIKAIAGVSDITKAVYMWDFAPDGFKSVLGLGKGDGRINAINARLLSGAPLTDETPLSLLVDNDFAINRNLKLNDFVAIGGQILTVAGLVDGATGSKIYSANIYLTLSSATVPDSFHKTNSINAFRGIFGLKRAVI